MSRSDRRPGAGRGCGAGKGAVTNFAVGCSHRGRRRRPDTRRGGAPHHETDHRGPLARHACGRRTLPGARATPAWPLLDALTQPPAAAEPREPARGTLVQLFGGLSAPPAAAALPASPSAAALALSAGRLHAAGCRPARPCRSPGPSPHPGGALSRGLGTAPVGRAGWTRQAWCCGPRDHAAGGGAAEPRPRRAGGKPRLRRAAPAR